MSNTRPLVAVACVCEKVLQEPDNVASLIRIVDTLTLPAEGAGEAEAIRHVALPITLFISLKSGDLSGSHEIGLVMRSPDGRVFGPQRWPFVFQGAEHGVNLTVNSMIVGQQPGRPPGPGLYWADVIWGQDEVLTSIPIRIKQAPASNAQPLDSNEQS